MKKKSLFLLAFFSFASLLFAEDAPLKKIELPGLSNTYQVAPGLFRGAQPEAEGFKSLKSLGIKSIINLRAFHSDKDMITGLGFQYFEIPILTWDMDPEYVINFLKIVSQPENLPVFVHCQHGADRTGTMIASYRIFLQNWSKQKALTEMTEGPFGFHAIWLNLKFFIKFMDVEKIKAVAFKKEN